MIFRPFGTRQRPIALVPNDELFSRVPDIQLYTRLLVPAVSLAFKEISKELLLNVDAVISVIVSPVLDAVHFEPFLFRGRPVKALEVAARMQRLSAPVRGR